MNPNPENITEEQISSMLRKKLESHSFAQKVRTAWVNITSAGEKCVSVSAMTEDFTIFSGTGKNFDEAVAECDRQLEVSPKIAALYQQIEELKSRKTQQTKEAA